MKEAYATFVREYRRTGDAKASALKAGSLERNAEADAQRWLQKPEVQAALSAPEERATRPRRPTVRRTRKRERG